VALTKARGFFSAASFASIVSKSDSRHCADRHQASQSSFRKLRASAQAVTVKHSHIDGKTIRIIAFGDICFLPFRPVPQS